MLNSCPAAESSRWRFSLKTLFLLMLLAAVAVWLTSWQMWDMDERIILGSWFVAVAAAIARSRNRGRRGVLLAATLGGIVPACFALAYYVLTLTIWSYTDVNGWEIPGTVLAVAIVGALSGAVVALVITPRGLLELSPSQRDDRRQQRLVVFTLLTVLSVLGAGAWWAYERAMHWTFLGGLYRAPLSSDFTADVFTINVRFELSEDGSCLKVAGPAKERNKQVLKIFRVKPFATEPVLSTVIDADAGTAWTANGKLLAVAETSDETAKISILSTERGIAQVDLVVPVPPDAWDEGTVSFSPSGDVLRFVTHKDDNPTSPTTFEWSAKDWKRLPDSKSVDLPESMAVVSKRSVNIAGVPKTTRFDDQQYQVEVWERGAAQPLHSFGPYREHPPVALSPNGAKIAIRSSLIDLETNSTQQLAGIAEQFLPNDRLLCSQEFAGWGRWRLPLLRHVSSGQSYWRMLLVNAKNGHVMGRSQWIWGSPGQVTASANGKVAATIDAERILLWEIPEH